MKTKREGKVVLYSRFQSLKHIYNIGLYRGRGSCRGTCLTKELKTAKTLTYFFISRYNKSK